MKYLSLFFIILVVVSCKKKDDNPDSGTNPNPLPDSVFMRGADLSFIPEIESYPVEFTDTSGNVKDVVTILKEAGCNTVRVRLWHTPSTEHSGFAEMAAFCERIKAAGMMVYLTMHYSDTWADPGQQTLPAAWKGLNMTQLKDSVYQYTYMVMSEIKPEFVSLGNEINDGMLWEAGRMGNGNNLYQLLDQASHATRKASPKSWIIIHYAGLDGVNAFFSQMKSHDIDFDVIGISYYPYWHGKNLSTVSTTLNGLARDFDKPVLIAETAYPFTLDWADMTHNIIGLESQLIPSYPATPQGQLDFMAALREMVSTLDKGAGFCYWGGDFVAFKGPDSQEGSSWENQALFDFDFHALPAIRVFHK